MSAPTTAKAEWAAATTLADLGLVDEDFERGCEYGTDEG